MTIQKLFKTFIQCDYSIYNIIMLSILLVLSFLFNHMANYKSCKKKFVTTFYGQSYVFSPIKFVVLTQNPLL